MSDSPFVHKGELDSQDRGLNPVESLPVLQLLVLVLGSTSGREADDPIYRSGITAGHDSPIVIGPEAFLRIKAETSQIPGASALAAPVFGMVGLGSVLKNA